MIKLYTHPLLGDMLDNGDVDYAVLDALEGVLKVGKRYITIWTDYARLEFLRFPVIKAMLDLNIIFKSKYYDLVTVEHMLYLEVIEAFVAERKAAMNAHERLRYKLYRKVKGIPMASKYSGVPLQTSWIDKKGVYPKKSYLWGDMGMLYYKLDPIEEGQSEAFL